MTTANKSEIVLYDDGRGNVELQVDTDADTLWATQEQIAQLFGIDRSVVTKHIRNILKDKELDENSVCAKIARTAPDGKVYRINTYNLDVILAVGYRTKSGKAMSFRRWASNILRNYLLQGYELNRGKLSASSDSIENLHKTLALIESDNLVGKIKGSVTLKVTKKLM